MTAKVLKFNKADIIQRLYAAHDARARGSYSRYEALMSDENQALLNDLEFMLTNPNSAKNLQPILKDLTYKMAQKMI